MIGVYCSNLSKFRDKQLNIRLLCINADLATLHRWLQRRESSLWQSLPLQTHLVSHSLASCQSQRTTISAACPALPKAPTVLNYIS